MNAAGFQRVAGGVLAAAALVLGGWVLASTLALLLDARWSGPAVDSWRFVKLLEAHAAGEPVWPLLVQVHGGHRPLFPRLLHWVEYACFGGRNAFLISCSVAFQLATWALLWRAASRGRGAVVAAFAAGVLLCLTFSSGQSENFARSWNVHWFLASAAAAASLACLAQVPARAGATRRGLLLAAAGFAAVASGSMANGLLVWPCLVLGAAALRLGRFELAALGAAALCCGAAFLWDYRPAPRGFGVAGLVEPAALALWVLRCLGGPFAEAVAESALPGAAGVGLLGVLLVRSVRVRRVEPAEVLMLGLVLFALASVLSIGWGRAGHGPESWRPPRYQTVSLLFWSALVALALARAPVSGRVALLLRAAALAGAALLLPGHWAEAERTAALARELRRAHLALEIGIFDPEVYRETLPFSERRSRSQAVWRRSRFLREQRLGMFHGARHTFVGRPLAAVAPKRSDACEGGLFAAIGSRPGGWVRLEGWARGTTRGREPELLLVTNPAGVVTGLGAPGLGAPERRGQRRFVAWRGPGASEASGSVWALLDAETACRVAEWVAQPAGAREITWIASPTATRPASTVVQ